MPPDAVLTLLAIAVAVSSLALLVHALASVGTYRAVKKLQEEISPLIPETREAVVQVQKSMVDAARDVREATARARVVLDAAHEQLEQFQQARTEIATRLKIQSERAELVIEDVLTRLQEVVGVVHGTVLKPVREVSGMVAGLKAAVQTFLMGRRPTVDRVTHDEEMFI